ncbi:protocatechuate 3,4-dioxygenase subunit alpha [Roseobacter sp. S98]|uniref:protocatechuate 3,4-dioxygenase subunit alpha n=1 Tax=Roseobacter algicola (ex Choi et al. 2025) (nom. illeg.) TaxID=3092138 RepID=UPI0035C7337B
MASDRETPSQTAGPYVHIGCMPAKAGIDGMYGGVDPGSAMILGPSAGEAVTLELDILDGEDTPLRDAMIEIWQAGPEGRFGATQNFSNWGRAATDAETGIARFETLKPGAAGEQAPHILVWITARGINLGLTTRIYFADEADRNAQDPVYCLAGERALTLVAARTPGGYRHTIRLQGVSETVFFDV